MEHIIDMRELPEEARASIINFYEFIKLKYNRNHRKKSKSKKKLISVMEKGIYKLPGDFTFNREELYDR